MEGGRVTAAREIRKRPCAEVICPRCGEKVVLIQETEEWYQQDGQWVHSDYGPGVADCCGLIFLDDPWGGLKAFEMRGSQPVSPEAKQP